ncbi:MAG: hypothetical protein QM598_11340, partial [Protaetiibacter sp.]
IYIVMCLILSGLAKWLEIRTRRSPRTGQPPVTRATVATHDITATQLIATQRDEPEGPRRP